MNRLLVGWGISVGTKTGWINTETVSKNTHRNRKHTYTMREHKPKQFTDMHAQCLLQTSVLNIGWPLKNNHFSYSYPWVVPHSQTCLQREKEKAQSLLSTELLLPLISSFRTQRNLLLYNLGFQDCVSAHFLPVYPPPLWPSTNNLISGQKIRQSGRALCTIGH